MATESSCSLIINKDVLFGTESGSGKGSGKGDRGTGIKVDEIRKKLETGNVEQKIEAMKQIIVATVNGERYPQLLMVIIRFVMPENNHYLKKLLFAYWECVEKVDPKTGKLRPEMILVCNLLLRDITHPNEYVCGTTLRLLTRIRDGEIVESLVPAVCESLQHRHAYVRRNAVWALCTIHQHWEHMVPNAADLVLKLLETETDAICIRNSLMMLYKCAPERCIAYINGSLEGLLGGSSGGEAVQLIVVNILYRVCKVGCTQAERARYIGCVAELLGSPVCSGTVKMEAAGTLLALSNAPSSVKSAALAYVDLLVNESDNNVKLVALGRVAEIARRYTFVMQDVVMDLLRALACPVLDVRRRALAVALDLVAEKNVAEVVAHLKRELARSLAAPAYRQLLVQAIHQCAVRFPVVAEDVVHVLMDYIQDPDVGASSAGSNAASSSFDVIAFVREAVEKYPALRPSIISKLAASLRKIRSSKVFRAALWVLGEYAETPADLAAAFAALRDALRDIPRVIAEREDAEAAAAAAAAKKEKEEEEEEEKEKASEAAPAAAPKKTNVRVLADGTYASQAAVMEQDPAAGAAGGAAQGEASGAGKALSIGAEARKRSPLLGQLMDGDHFLGAVAAYTLAKLAIKLGDAGKKEEEEGAAAGSNRTAAEAMLALAQILRLGTSRVVPRPMDTDSRARIVLCINALADPAHPARALIVSPENRRAFVALLAEQASAQQRAAATGLDGTAAAASTSATKQGAKQQQRRAGERQSDDLIRIRQLTARTRTTLGDEDDAESDETSGENGGSENCGGENGAGDVTDDVIALAKLDANGGGGGADGNSASARLKRVVQLTGFGDPLYAEAFVYVHQYDIVLDVIVTNQTNVTLQEVTLELSTLGDLRLFERPAPVTIAPGVTSRVRAGLKVSSTETGTIFGNLIFELSGQSVTQVTADRNCVPLNEIRIDIIDYIRPATCTDIKFRQMWAEFEWENKIAVAAAPFPTAAEYLEHIVEITNMNCLTPQSALAGDCNFLSANLYARSVFGEDALINVSVEAANGKVSGFVRIRSKTQGIALSLGDKIVQYQSKKDKKK